MKIQDSTIVVIEQNVTEAALPQAYWAADILILSETNQDLIRRHAPAHWSFYFPAGDSHQVIGWNTETFRLDDVMRNGRKRNWATRSFRFHRSGLAEHWKLRTPARWIHEVDLIHIATGELLTIGAMWWLNSWRKEKRRWKIIMQRTVPVVKARMARCEARGRLGLYGGDTNHVTFNFRGFFRGFRAAPRFGLDRLFWTRTKRLTLKSLRKGHKIGVGNQLKHESLIAEYVLRTD